MPAPSCLNQAVLSSLSITMEPAKTMQMTQAARNWISLNSQAKLLVSLPGSVLVSKPMVGRIGGQKHLGSLSLGSAGHMLSPSTCGARALVPAWLFSSASPFAAGHKGRLSFTFTMPRRLSVAWVRRRSHAYAG